MDKRCTKCGELKPLEDFNRDKRKSDGRESHCRSCRAERGRRYREANPERIHEKNRRYREANPERERQRYRRYKVEWYAALKASIQAHYGEACACCGTTERLTIDHVNGGGNGHRRELFGRKGSGSPFYSWLIEQGFPAGYQTLCLPCNTSKGTGERCQLDHARAAAAPSDAPAADWPSPADMATAADAPAAAGALNGKAAERSGTP